MEFDTLLLGIVIGMIIISSIGLGFYWYFEVRPYQSTYTGLKMNLCSNLTIHEAAKCARDLTEPFYIYNMTNIDTDLNLEQLKEVGGVCWHWANYYCDIGEELGYYTYQPMFRYDEDNKHQICIWSDDTGYVVIDQLVVRHVGLGGED